MSRKHYTDIIGTLGSGGLTNVATTHTFTSLTYANGTAVPTLTGTDTFLLSILDGSGNVLEVINVTAYNSGTKVATIARAQEGTTAIAHAGSLHVANGVYPSDLGGAGVGIIGHCQYAPGTTDTKASTSTTSVDIDASNLVVPFVGPPSGLVEVTRSVVAHMTSTTNEQHWTIRSGSSDVAGGGVTAMVTYAGAINAALVTAVNRISVTPGTSYTWKWGWFRIGAGSGTMNLYCGDGHDLGAPAIMKVVALP